jgi:pyruvate formate lyase activating enzyme
MSKAIYNITPFTLLDFPDKIACIIWFAGCNMNCKYCYNIDIVNGKGKMTYDEVIRFLDTRKDLLDGVVLSGGECMIHSGLENFMLQIKERNMQIKIDTNGSHPKVLKNLMNRNLVDYVALDFKGLVEDFYHITQSHFFRAFEETLELLIDSTLSFEVRTTVHSNLIGNQQLEKMKLYLESKKYRGKYYLQAFLNDVPTLGNMENDYQHLNLHNLSSKLLDVVVRN